MSRSEIKKAEQQAFKQAKRLWGRAAHVERSRKYRKDETTKKLVKTTDFTFAVGYRFDIGICEVFVVKGQGDSWAEAFQNAEAKNKPKVKQSSA